MIGLKPAKNWGQPTLSQGAPFAAWTERAVPSFSPRRSALVAYALLRDASPLVAPLNLPAFYRAATAGSDTQSRRPA
jgi:hypothetical protein